MFVYFIRTRAKPPMVKIGKANDPQSRMAELQTGCPYNLELIGKIPCKSEAHAFEIEESAHHVFRKFRVRGEWFKYKRIVESAVEAMLAGKAKDLRVALARAGSLEQGYSEAKKRIATAG